MNGWTRGRTLIVASGAALALMATIVLLADPGLPQAGRTASAASVDVGSHSTVPAKVDTETASVLDRTPAIARCVLQVRVRDRGRPVPAHLSWVQSPDLHDLADGLAAGTSSPRHDDARAQHARIDGVVDLTVQSGLWTWIRVSAEGRAPSFHRVAPITFDSVHEIELPSSPRLHVQVVGPDWRTPVPHARLQLLCGEPTNPTVSATAVERIADASGYALLTDLPRGRILLTAKGASTDGQAPATACVIWGIQPCDVAILLVEADPSFEVTITAHVVQGSRSVVPPKLFLTRTDGIRSRPMPQRGSLVPGHQDLQFRLPAGRYEISVLPTGELRIDGDRFLDVSGDGSASSISLTPQSDRTAIRLVGPDLGDPPLRVNIEPAAGLRYDDPDTMFVGPLHWGATEESIPRLIDPQIVTCIGRHRAFISRGAVDLNRAHVDVDLVPASCLTVQWLRDGLHLPEPPVLVVSHVHGTAARPFERDLVDQPGGRRPALVARIVVPLGDTVLEAHVGGRVLWRRQSRVEARRLLLTVSRDP